MNAATAYVALGSNLDGPREHVLRAFEELAQLPETRLVRRSALYRSAPVAPAPQPDFVNAVAQLETRLEPRRLLTALQDIETRHGRERPYPTAPRTLDLDLLLYDETVIDSPELTLPHPRMHARAFVLEPLAELAAQVRIPGHGRVDELRRSCIGQRIERIA